MRPHLVALVCTAPLWAGCQAALCPSGTARSAEGECVDVPLDGEWVDDCSPGSMLSGVVGSTDGGPMEEHAIQFDRFAWSFPDSGDRKKGVVLGFDSRSISQKGDSYATWTACDIVEAHVSGESFFFPADNFLVEIRLPEDVGEGESVSFADSESYLSPEAAPGSVMVAGPNSQEGFFEWALSGEANVERIEVGSPLQIDALGLSFDSGGLSGSLSACYCPSVGLFFSEAVDDGKEGEGNPQN